MNLRHIGAAAGIAAFMVAASANATVHRVFPNESIQAAIDAAAPGDTILVEPGTYEFEPGPFVPSVDDPEKPGKYYYGLRIKTDNLRLIGKVIPGKGEAGKVRLLYKGPDDRADDVGAGIYAAPAGCDFYMEDDSPEGEDCKLRKLEGFYLRGFTVEGFPRNGIQTRWVNGFEFIRNESANNLNNGIYPTLSANGLVQNNISYGSLDTAMWVAGSENVRVIGNEVFGSVIGFEITVSSNVLFTQNKVHGNTLGIGLFHPRGAGNPPTAVPAFNSWVIEHNDVRNNNLPNGASPNTFQGKLPPGIGILLSGVSGHTIAKNTVEGNKLVGIAVLGWCTANQIPPQECPANTTIDGVFYSPEVSNTTVSHNKVSGNGGNPNPMVPFPSVDILYVQFPLFLEPGTGNCFEKNKPSGFTYFASTQLAFVGNPPEPVPVPGELPTDGCKQP